MPIQCNYQDPDVATCFSGHRKKCKRQSLVHAIRFDIVGRHTVQGMPGDGSKTCFLAGHTAAYIRDCRRVQTSRECALKSADPRGRTALPLFLAHRSFCLYKACRSARTISGTSCVVVLSTSAPGPHRRSYCQPPQFVTSRTFEVFSACSLGQTQCNCLIVHAGAVLGKFGEFPWSKRQVKSSLQSSMSKKARFRMEFHYSQVSAYYVVLK